MDNETRIIELEAALAAKTAECERMQAENEQLSAGVCTNLIGDERGNPTCAAREQLAVLTLEYEDRLAELEAALAENTRLQAALRRHGVAIVYGDRDVGMNALRARIAELEAALATRTAELEEVSVEYQTLIEDIEEYLPAYQMDRADGEFDEANERERIEYAAAELEDLKVRAEKAEAECERMRGLIEELCDEEECSYDHHGYCQTHSLHPKPCPHERARATLAAKTAEMKYHNGANLRARQDDPIKVELMALATECKGRADHCGRLARAVLAAADGEEE